RMPVKALLVAAGLAALWVVGVIDFPRALEPGRSERDGITLSFRNLRLDGSGDWAFTRRVVALRSVPRGLVVTARPGGVAVVSRDLPVFPHTCYGIRVDAVGGDGFDVQALDLGRSSLSPTVPLGRSTETDRLRFSS